MEGRETNDNENIFRTFSENRRSRSTTGGILEEGTTVLPRYIYSVPESRGLGRWTWYDFLALSLMIRGGVVARFGDTR